MRIRLHEISEEGKSFTWTRKSGEMGAALDDLIGNQDFTAQFFIKPLNSRDFELTGTLISEAPEQCSRCGIDFILPLDLAIKEILIPRQEQDRTGRYTRVNHLSETLENGPDVVEYDVDVTFNAGEYFHAQVGLAMPFNPAPKEDAKGDCRLCGVKVRGRTFGYNEELPQEKPQNPFNVLKNLKI